MGSPGAKGEPGKAIAAPSIVAPPLVLSIVINETGTASFQCEAVGNPQPKVTWLKDNTSIASSNRAVLPRKGLVITEVTSQDSGNVQLRSKEYSQSIEILGYFDCSR